MYMLCNCREPPRKDPWASPYADASPATLQRTTVDDATAAASMLARISADNSDGQPPNCVGRCKSGVCTISAFAKHCCYSRRKHDYGILYSQQQGGKDHAGAADAAKAQVQRDYGGDYGCSYGCKGRWSCWDYYRGPFDQP